MIIKPPRLRKGDMIGIVAPSGPVQMQKLQKGIEYLKNNGFAVSLGKYTVRNTGYLAGTDRERLEDFTKMIVDPNVKAVFFARGDTEFRGSFILLIIILLKIIRRS